MKRGTLWLLSSGWGRSSSRSISRPPPGRRSSRPGSGPGAYTGAFPASPPVHPPLVSHGTRLCHPLPQGAKNAGEGHKDQSHSRSRLGEQFRTPAKSGRSRPGEHGERESAAELRRAAPRCQAAAEAAHCCCLRLSDPCPDRSSDLRLLSSREEFRRGLRTPHISSSPRRAANVTREPGCNLRLSES